MDLFVKKQIKFGPELAFYHCETEYLFAGLQELDPRVTRFVPQPFKIAMGKNRYYVPDIYIEYEYGTRKVYELKAGGMENFSEKTFACAERFFSDIHIEFGLISNDVIARSYLLGDNAQKMVRHLLLWQEESTELMETEILEEWQDRSVKTLKDLVKIFDEYEAGIVLAAIFKLIRKGRLLHNLASHKLSDQTRIWIP